MDELEKTREEIINYKREIEKYKRENKLLTQKNEQQKKDIIRASKKEMN